MKPGVRGTAAREEAAEGTKSVPFTSVRFFWLVSRYSSISNSLCSYFSSHSTATKLRKSECSDYIFSAINSRGCCQISLFEIALFIVGNSSVIIVL